MRRFHRAAECRRGIPPVACARRNPRPGVSTPTRFSGSTAESRTVSPVRSSLRVRRSASTAPGSAYCSPTKPVTNLPPRIAPRASSLRSAHRISRQETASVSRTSRSRNKTPQRASSCSATASARSSGSPARSGGGSSAQRPSAPARPREPRRSKLCLRPRRSRSRAPSSDRTDSKPSAATRPRATRSQSPCSTSTGAGVAATTAVERRARAPQVSSRSRPAITGSVGWPRPRAASSAGSSSRSANAIVVRARAPPRRARFVHASRRRRRTQPSRPAIHPRGRALSHFAAEPTPAQAAPLFPRPRRQLEALELLHHREHPAPALALRPGRHVLPAQQEAQEILRGHRLDLAPQTLVRVEMDAREQAPRADLLRAGGFRREAPAQGEALGLQASDRLLDPGRRQTSCLRQRRERERTRGVEMPAHDHAAAAPLQGPRAASAAGSATSGVKRASAKRLDGGAARSRTKFPSRRDARERPARTSSRSPAPIRARRHHDHESSVSCSSSASLGAGAASSRTLAIASGSRRPRSRAVSGSPRRSTTARVRRSSSGASSRKVNGRPFRISCASGEGSVTSRRWRLTPPASTEVSRPARASTSIASCKQS